MFNITNHKNNHSLKIVKEVEDADSIMSSPGMIYNMILVSIVMDEEETSTSTDNS